MQADISLIYDSMSNKLGVACTSLAAVIIAASFLQWVAVFFLLIVLQKYKPDPKKENVKEV